MIASIRPEGREHPDPAIVGNPFVKAQCAALWVASQWKLHMQVSIANVDEAILNWDIDSIGRAPEIVQVALTVLTMRAYQARH
jgi:hypothetical protein